MDNSTKTPVPRKRKALRRTKPGTSRVTMTDIAREAGCSQATVSLVLNRTEGVKISPETRARVIEVARTLGYSPANFPDLLRTDMPAGDERVIAFVVDQIATSPEAAIAIEGARLAAWGAGDIILAAQTLSDPIMEPRTIEKLLSCGATEMIYMTIITRELQPHDILYKLGIPLVLLNCYTGDHAFPAVIPSEIAGGEAATRHLIQHGHRRIGTILGETWMDAARDRFEGYRRALATADIPFDPALVAQGDWSTTGGFIGTQKLLALTDPPTAIFCHNDRTAVGCYDAIREAGLRIPEDISVVGYDDEEISRHLRPRLTTCILPHRAMGRWAIERLSEPFPSEKKRHGVTKIECSLVTRESVGPPPKSR
ncbi:LacI family DNA-binding transcriptional regulator [Agrobacterium pusense]|uniref:LacI family DNA-binding transcriptional regulator n=1 Tax=Agrobacterium pusense TaxID=648995 RepID=UPI002FDE171D